VVSLRERIRNAIRKLIGVEEKEEEKRLYRMQEMRLYIGVVTGKKRRTPEPFAEFRTWLYTDHPEEYDFSEFDDVLDRALAAFFTIIQSLGYGYIDYTINTELEEIDIDEAESEVAFGFDNVHRGTGVTFETDLFYRYMVFYRLEGDVSRVHKEYNEKWFRDFARLNPDLGIPVIERGH